MDNRKIQSNIAMQLGWNNFIRDLIIINLIGKKECLVSKIKSRVHDEQSLQIQVKGLPSRGDDQRCIQKLKNLILEFFQEGIILVTR